MCDKFGIRVVLLTLLKTTNIWKSLTGFFLANCFYILLIYWYLSQFFRYLSIYSRHSTPYYDRKWQSPSKQSKCWMCMRWNRMERWKDWQRTKIDDKITRRISILQFFYVFTNKCMISMISSCQNLCSDKRVFHPEPYSGRSANFVLNDRTK